MAILTAPAHYENDLDDNSRNSDFLERHFDLRGRKTSVKGEFRAALATFLTMCYILLVNPQLLAKIGLSPEAIVISTALSSAVGCIIAGYFGNMPLGLSPGLGLSAYLTYGLVLGDGQSVPQAFTTCFVSGVILLVFSVTGLSQVIMKIIPRSVKLATIVGMGLQIALVGMTSVKLVVENKETIVGLGSLSNYQIWLSLFGLLLIGSLLFHQIEGGILIGIAVMTFLTWVMEDKFPTSYVQFPNFSSIDASKFIDFTSFDWNQAVPGLLAFLFIGLIDVSGVIFGMASLAGIVQDDGSIPGTKGTFVGVSVSTLVSAMTGGTPIIVYVESASGIKDGGRTGLTAVFIGVFFLISLFLAPVLSSIPLTATSPVAILIGAMMMSQAIEIDWNNMSDAIPAFLTMTIMPFTFSITNGIIFGLISAFFFYITTGQCYRDLTEYFSNRGSAGSDEENKSLQGNSSHGSGNGKIRSKTMSEDATSSFLDSEPFIRTPSLILKKQDADAVMRRSNHGSDHGGDARVIGDGDAGRYTYM